MMSAGNKKMQYKNLRRKEMKCESNQITKDGRMSKLRTPRTVDITAEAQ